ncbi:hypothetical protein [Porcincola intestinalis]|uniref:hypothetical protein n=1 Tax=Porcincola intestinalis TaxID=2606632 RepID=UPI002A83E4DA|nr:hypothetical protein [Porcincola intestinalis]MDY4205511.1 hypothetical protein [Porcincola intestinalis]
MRRKVIIKALSAGIAAGFLALVRPENQPGMGVTALIAIAFYMMNCRALSSLIRQKHYYTATTISDRYRLSRWADTKVGA